jgi:hypothetical protein
MWNIMKKLAFLATCAVANTTFAQDSSLSNPSISAVLDAYYQSTDRVLGGREEGFGLGETEFVISAAIDDMFYGKLTTVVAVSDSETELELEEAFIQTTALPGGFSIRAGRFLSDAGYLNNQHVHSDNFIDRPGAYRAFMGGHYFDDGIRLSYLAPTDLYWSTSIELFSGSSLQAEGIEAPQSVGIYNLITKVGGDINVESSWQLGLTWSHNKNGQGFEHEEGEENVVHEDEHGHNHEIAYLGENTLISDFVYKWAPDGNYKYNHFALSGEYFYIDDFMPQHDEDGLEEEAHLSTKDHMSGWYLSGVYQVSPSWSTGIRYGETQTALLEGENAGDQKLQETELMLAWHNSHFSKVTLQYTHQEVVNFEGFRNDNIISLQFVSALGAHNAHQF